jgi:hypothetical protein
MFQKYHFFHNPKLQHHITRLVQPLGTIFSRKGNFGRNKARLVQQARKVMFYVLRKARKLSLPIDILLPNFSNI